MPSVFILLFYFIQSFADFSSEDDYDPSNQAFNSRFRSDSPNIDMESLQRSIVEYPYLKYRSSAYQQDESKLVSPIIPRMLYWHTTQQHARENFHFPSLVDGKYLTFEPDFGGFNNIRMGFEFAVLLAALMGRTLVLPPPLGWYLLDWGAYAEGSGTSRFEEFFDISDLNKVVPTLTTRAFIDKEAKNLGIPLEYWNFTNTPKNQELSQSWIHFLRENAFTPKWNPLQSVVCWPTKKSILKLDEDILEHYTRGKHKVEYTEKLRRKAILHFPMDYDNGHRLFGQVSSSIVFADDALRHASNRLRRNHIHYRNEIFYVASKVVNFLGAGMYTSLHVRRGELQYHHVKIKAHSTLENIEALLTPKQKIYISTDESPEFFDIIENAGYQVYHWSDFNTDKGGNVLDGVYIDKKIRGMIEQVIAAMGNRFFGTKLSTFSAFIYRLRGYMHSSKIPTEYDVEYDTNIYYHNNKHTGITESDRAETLKEMGPNDWDREFVSSWTDLR